MRIEATRRLEGGEQADASAKRREAFYACWNEKSL